ncbi:MAG: putative bifunctional diguanylate cyclase/phosphodiesterase [Sphingomonadaceae bacterium]
MSKRMLADMNWRVVFNHAVPTGRKGWGRVRAAQVREMAHGVTLAAWGHAINALLLVAILYASVPDWQLSAWLLAIASAMLVAARYQRRALSRELHLVPRRAIERAAYHSILFGFVWAAPAVFFFGLASPAEQLAICIVTVGMMAGAAFVFVTVPPAAIAYIAILGAAIWSLFIPTTSLAVIGIPIVYTIGLMIVVVANGRAYMERKFVEFELEERTETISLLLREFENSDADWLWQTDGQLRFHNVSARFARAIGRKADELEGLSLRDMLDEQCRRNPEAKEEYDRLLEALQNRQTLNEFILPVHYEGEARSIEISARPRYNQRGRFTGYRGVGSDVTEQKRAADKISHMARHDALTGLPNRFQLIEAMEEALDKAVRRGGQCALLLIDLDRFKTVNDALGHVAGDHLLIQVAARLDSLVGGGMTVGRLGGDEFALVVPEAVSRAAIEQLGRKIIAALQTPFTYDDQRLFVGASIGAALVPKDGSRVEEIIRNADLALYRAKEDGGDELRFYEPSLHAEAEERRQIEVALRTALEKGEFSLVYQPVIDVKAGRIASFEALIRWTSAELGQIGPDRFIPIAEETGLIGRIGEWVLRTACSEAAGWPDEISVSVNISPRQLQEPSFVGTLVSALSLSGIDPRRLELEITETAFLNLTPLAEQSFHRIHGLGVRLAMDDFGTGYSSLGYLRTTHFDTLKIDRSFVLIAKEKDTDSLAVIKAVVALAETLDMVTVAEGVETKEQLDLIAKLGCDRIQGFVHSRPLSGKAAREMIDAPPRYHVAA